MSMQTQISEKVQQSLSPDFLEVINESHMHNVPEGSESHFKLTVVSPEFEGLMLIKRHRMVNETLKDELKQIHALALHTLTPDEWFERAGKVVDSPLCQGGGK